MRLARSIAATVVVAAARATPRRAGLRPATALALVAAVPSLLAGCGQTGALYLPEDEGATVITRPGPADGAAPPDAPVPATPPADDASPPARRGSVRPGT